MASSHLFTNIHAPWEKNDNVIWLASTLKLRRNIEKFKFPSKLELDRKKHIFSLLTGIFSPLTLLKNPYTLKAEEVSSDDKEFLFEQFLLSEGFQEAPAGTGFGLDETGEFIALFNIKEHIQLQITDTKGNLEESWATLVEIENQFSKNINFAFSQKFGFLTSDLFACGTGLTVTCFLHLPALIHTNTLVEALEKEKSEGIVVTGLQGNPDEFIGDILMVRNLFTLGVNEETIITTMRNAILHLVLAEKAARSKIKNEMPTSIKNAIFRAIGLLKYSYQLEAAEALAALSLIKLGIELGCIKGMSVETINRLLFYSRRSHLGYARGDVDATQYVAEHRAEYLRQAIDPITIKLPTDSA
jgi:protein arginine kinase